MRTEEEIKAQREKHIQGKHDWIDGNVGLDIYYAIRDVYDWVLGIKEDPA